MKLASSDGASLELRPTRYQFGEASRDDVNRADEWDPNWLDIHGEVRTAVGDAWSFDDPCLTTWEARELAAWLRDAAEGHIAPTDDPAEDSPGFLAFTEPNLAFSLAALDETSVVLRAHLSAEAVKNRPTTLRGHHKIYAYNVALTVGRASLLAAAQAWQEDLTPFPQR